MELPEEIKKVFNGSCFINIGDETCAVFLPGSIYLFSLFKKFPMLYKAIIEGVKCAENGYYSIGILVFSQLMIEYSVECPEERYSIAHEILKKLPTEQEYKKIRENFDEIATKKIIDEFSRYKNRDQDYKKAFDENWGKLFLK